jgi:aminoglycoside phosphotransferase (APT) family kinase protein
MRAGSKVYQGRGAARGWAVLDAARVRQIDKIQNKVLEATHGFLTRLLSADVLSGDLLTEAHMAATALGYEMARGSYDPARLEQMRLSERALANELRHHLGGQLTAPVSRRWDESWRAGVGASLVGLIEGADAKIADDHTVAQWLRDFLVAYHEPMDPTVGAGTRGTYQGGRGDRQEQEGGGIYITAPALQEYLHRRFPETLTQVNSVKRLMGGYSKETYVVRLQDEAGERSIVIRKDGYGLPTGSSVASEFEVLKTVHALGVPTPEPLWVEADPGPFAAAFMAVSHMGGTPANRVVPADAVSRAAWADEFARVLALLHGSSVRREPDVREVLHEEIADLRRRVLERERQPHPGLSMGLAWLETHLDDLGDRPACRVHGDVGFHNMLMQGDRLTALLDWEFSHLGDPVEDLVMIRQFLEPIDSWPRFLKGYEAQSGINFDPVSARYFAVWTEVRNMIACLGSLNSLLLPQVKDVALSVAGTIYIPKYEIAVLDAVLQENDAHE